MLIAHNSLIMQLYKLLYMTMVVEESKFWPSPDLGNQLANTDETSKLELIRDH